MEKNENNFEQKIKELEVIVKELESGEVNLDEAIETSKKAAKAAGAMIEVLDALN